MPERPPNINDEIVEYMRQNDGELPQDYLPKVTLPLTIRIKHALGNIIESIRYSMQNFRAILSSIILFITIIAAICMGFVGLSAIVVDYLNNDHPSPTPTQTFIGNNGTPRPTQTPYPTLPPYLFEPPPLPCQITNLSSRPAAIYDEANRDNPVALFTEGETLQVIGDDNQKWYAVQLADDTIGWFYYQDTYLERTYCD